MNAADKVLRDNLAKINELKTNIQELTDGHLRRQVQVAQHEAYLGRQSQMPPPTQPTTAAPGTTEQFFIGLGSSPAPSFGPREPSVVNGVINPNYHNPEYRQQRQTPPPPSSWAQSPQQPDPWHQYNAAAGGANNSNNMNQGKITVSFNIASQRTA